MVHNVVLDDPSGSDNVPANLPPYETTGHINNTIREKIEELSGVPSFRSGTVAGTVRR
jgi:hypothetical protein